MGEVFTEGYLKNKYIILFATVAVVTLFDFITKAYISSTMSLHESFVVIGGFVSNVTQAMMMTLSTLIKFILMQQVIQE